mmetsp:Transcript_18732/g.22428  ORF Transcript_18732/g.22428 Transcript_18732/m.22428 type:complete len:85 (-) Transcript_18732:146-400(-)
MRRALEAFLILGWTTISPRRVKRRKRLLLRRERLRRLPERRLPQRKRRLLQNRKVRVSMANVDQYDDVSSYYFAQIDDVITDKE